MTIRYREGDLFAAVSEMEGSLLIPHVCNDRGKWGAGFVLPLARRFPVAQAAYLAWYASPPTHNEVAFIQWPFQIGHTQIVSVSDEESRSIYVANMVAQTLGGKRPLNYGKLVDCMQTVAEFCHQNGMPSIVAPMFGSDLAGGNWLFIEELIRDIWCDSGINVTIHYLPERIPTNWTPPNEEGR